MDTLLSYRPSNLKKRVFKDIRYTIKPNTHYAIRHTKKRGVWVRNIGAKFLPYKLTRGCFRQLQVNMCIPEENWHTNPDPKNKNWNDINKLIGVNFGLLSGPHVDSFRIGYIYNWDTIGKVRLYLYYYKDRVWTYTPVDEPVCEVRTGTPFEITLSFQSFGLYIHIWQEYDLYKANALQNEQESYLEIEPEVMYSDPNKKWFSVLEPYHGGDLKAIQKQTFYLNRLAIKYI